MCKEDNTNLLFLQDEDNTNLLFLQKEDNTNLLFLQEENHKNLQFLQDRMKMQIRQAEDSGAQVKRGEYRTLALERWNQVQHPLHGLGLLEDAVVQIAGLIQSADVRLDKKAVVVFCADNGVTAENVTQADSSVTAVVAHYLAKGRTSVCRMACLAGVDVIPVDLGIRDFQTEEGVLDRRIANGSKDILYGPAMTREEALRAILTGIDLAGELKDLGYQILAAGEMGIGNTTTSAACCSVLLGYDPGQVTGKGAGLSDAGLAHKIVVVREAIRNNGLTWEKRSDDPANDADTIEVLRRVGGFDILGMCGMYLGGLIHGIPVIIDGFVSSIAALAAFRLCPDCADAMLASHVSSEPAARLILDAIGKPPLITGELHLGEGTGAVLVMPMLDMALAVYREGYTFAEGGIEPYRPL